MGITYEVNKISEYSNKGEMNMHTKKNKSKSLF